jgi:hypothetical protein
MMISDLNICGARITQESDYMIANFDSIEELRSALLEMKKSSNPKMLANIHAVRHQAIQKGRFNYEALNHSQIEFGLDVASRDMVKDMPAHIVFDMGQSNKGIIYGYYLERIKSQSLIQIAIKMKIKGEIAALSSSDLDRSQSLKDRIDSLKSRRIKPSLDKTADLPVPRIPIIPDKRIGDLEARKAALRARLSHQPKAKGQALKNVVCQIENGRAPSVTGSTAGDYIMWVGYQYYPTIDKFIEEACRLGISKRICKVPQDLVLGESRIYFVHDEGCFHHDKDGAKINDAVIFGYTTIEKVEMIVKNKEEAADMYPDYAHDFVLMADIASEEERGCGMRSEEGAMYLVNTATGQEKARYDEKLKEVVMSGALVILNSPVCYNTLVDPLGTRFRSYRKFDRKVFLGGNPNIKEVGRPSETAKKTIHKNVKMATKIREGWSDGEKNELMRLCSKFGMYKGCKEFARQTIRSFQGCIYQYRQMKEKELEGGSEV